MEAREGFGKSWKGEGIVLNGIVLWRGLRQWQATIQCDGIVVVVGIWRSEEREG